MVQKYLLLPNDTSFYQVVLVEGGSSERVKYLAKGLGTV
jgi:hypothetical protein